MQEDWNILLTVLESPDSAIIGKQRSFSTSPITTGRADECDLVIADPTMSRNHAIIRITNDYTRVFITDKSTYGTEVSGQAVPKGPGSGFTLSDGDIIKMGNTTLRYELKLKMSVQATFVGQVDRSFLDEPPAPDVAAPEKSPGDELPDEPVVATVKSGQKVTNYIYLAIITISIAFLLYIIFKYTWITFFA